jgi:hypothetical protein
MRVFSLRRLCCDRCSLTSVVFLSPCAGSIKYFDLFHKRASDYKFSYDQMLDLRG